MFQACQKEYIYINNNLIRKFVFCLFVCRNIKNVEKNPFRLLFISNSVMILKTKFGGKFIL